MGIKVVSLFDGYAGAYQALKILGIEVDEYHASEVDKPAMEVAKKNHPDINYLGDVRFVNALLDGLEDTDLLIGGSPCQGFSFAGKQLNFEDPRSKLFFEFVRLRDEIQPKYFLLENVFMKKEYQDVISRYLGVKPIEINSNLLSAQNRRRLYWTNIPMVSAPQDKGILLKDIVHENVDIAVSAVGSNNKAHALLASYDGAVVWNSYERHQRTMLFEELASYIVPFDKTLQILNKEISRGKVGYFRKNSQANRVYYIHGKAVTLCGDAGGGAAKMGQHLFGCITPDRVEKRQNGQRFNDGQKFYTLTAQEDQHGGVLAEGYIRKLTPVECERLQTLPDDYTGGVSKTQRYRMLGNGFTVEVIAHILSYMLVAEL